jgi:hypothetical protein
MRRAAIPAKTGIAAEIFESDEKIQLHFQENTFITVFYFQGC